MALHLWLARQWPDEAELSCRHALCFLHFFMQSTVLTDSVKGLALEAAESLLDALID